MTSQSLAKLAAVMMEILVIPHSDASSERIFRCAREIRTESRPNLSRVYIGMFCLVGGETSMFASGDVCYKQMYVSVCIYIYV